MMTSENVKWDTCQGYTGPFMFARLNGHGLMARPRPDRTWVAYVDRDVLPGSFASSAEAKAAAETAATS